MELVVLLLIATAVSVVFDVLAASMILTPWLVLLVLVVLLVALFKIPAYQPGLSVQGATRGDRSTPDSPVHSPTPPPSERANPAPPSEGAIAASTDGDSDLALTYRGAHYHHPTASSAQETEQQVEQVCMYRGKVYKTLTCIPKSSPESQPR